jgi:hypothetical protein
LSVRPEPTPPESNPDAPSGPLEGLAGAIGTLECQQPAPRSLVGLPHRGSRYSAQSVRKWLLQILLIYGGNIMESRSGWSFFAGIMILVVGALNIFDGLVAITQSHYISRNTGGALPLTNNVKNWGWVELILGVIIVLAAFGIFSGATWGRVVGILVASLNLFFQFAYLGHYPFWSFTMIVIDILIIYGLAAHGGRTVEEM